MSINISEQQDHLRTLVFAWALTLSLSALGVAAQPVPAPPTSTPAAAEASAALGAVARVEAEAISNFQRGLGEVLDRRYAAAHALFEEESAFRPESAVGPLGLMLSLEAEMLEYEDFRHDDQFKRAAAVARSRLKSDLSKPGDEAWDHLLAGAFYGLRGMHALRKKNYVFSVRKGMAAVNHLERARSYDNALPDIDLGLGAYTYFRARLRTIVPWSGTPDGRQRGIEQISRAHNNGVLVHEVAQLALVILLLDERQTTESMRLARDLIDRHPGNVMARVQLARGLGRRARYSDALATLDEALELAPDHPLLPYYQGNLHYIAGGNLALAEDSLQRFVGAAPSREWRAAGLERLGDVRLRLRRPDDAIQAWSEAQQLRSRSRVASKLQRARRIKARQQPTS